MRDTMMEHGLRPPVFDFADGYFVVTLPGHEQAWSSIRVAPGLWAKLERQEQRVINLVMTRGRLATSECAKELDVGVATARRHLRKLVDKGLLESRGSGPQLAYYLAGSESKTRLRRATVCSRITRSIPAQYPLTHPYCSDIRSRQGSQGRSVINGHRPTIAPSNQRQTSIGPRSGHNRAIIGSCTNRGLQHERTFRARRSECSRRKKFVSLANTAPAVLSLRPGIC